MALKHFPFNDIYKSQFERQFTETPAAILANNTPFFKTDEAVFCITEIEAAAGFTLVFINQNGHLQTRGGSGNTQYYLPIVVNTLQSAAGVTRISGFWLDTKTTY
jgi:hypothetical protein